MTVYTPIIEEQTAVQVYRRHSSSPTPCSTAGSGTNLGNTTLTRYFRKSTAEGVQTHNFSKLKNSGALLPFTYWDRTFIEGRAELGSRGWCDSSGRRHNYENFYWSGGPCPLLADWDVYPWYDHIDVGDLQYYVQKAAAAIYSSGWDAGTFLAEIGQLRRMLSNVGKKLSNLSKGYSAGELHDLWLEGRYGWRTLMYDIRDLHEVLSRANERRTRYREQKGLTTTGSYNESLMHGSGINVLCEFNMSWTINVRGTVIADIDVPDFQFNPVTTLWEVTRLSFVIDWLLNVGQALEAASFLLAVKDYKAGAGYRVDIDIESKSNFVSNIAPNTNGYHTGICEGQVRYVRRIPATVSAFPRVKLRLDEYKILDILALIRQRL